MTLENQVSSLAPSQRLKELGVKQDSLYVWVPAHTEGHVVRLRHEPEPNAAAVSAFTVAELGEMLPEWITHDDIDVWITCSMADKDSEYTVRYGYIDKGAFLIKAGQIAKTEADARAKMLIYLVENQLITI